MAVWSILKPTAGRKEGETLLTKDEIKKLLQADAASLLKKEAKVGQDYYEAQHDILDYRMFYFNAEGILVEDTVRSNVKIPHPFFTELVDQGTQFVLSGKEPIFTSKDAKLQEQLDLYFNKNRRFLNELGETVTGMQAKGFDYMYAYKGTEDRLEFECADCLGVVEVEGRFAEDKKEQRIWKYVDKVDKDGKTQWKIRVIDDENTYYYVQEDNGEIKEDTDVSPNPRPHALYKDKDGKLYTKDLKLLPFFRLDANKKRTSYLKPIKPIIDDYDMMNSSLTNNLIDFDIPLYAVKGFKGDNLDELQQNLKTKKMIGIPEEGGGVEVHTIEVPYQARVAKLELDEKNIYRFGMGLNMQGLKDTAATTNIAIKAAYSLLELRGGKIIDQLELFLQELLKPVLDEINEKHKTDYQLSHVDFNFKPEIMSNAHENAQIELTTAQKKQTEINTLLSLADRLDNETIIKAICEQLDIDYEEIEGKLPDPDEAAKALEGAAAVLDGAETDPEPFGGGVGE